MARSADTYQKGRRAEYLAAALLWMKGYRVRAMRHMTPYGEIDILASRGQHLLVVEVKARAHKDQALEAISARQRQRLERAARHWVSCHGGEEKWQIRFDAILVENGRLPCHMKDMWRPEGW